MMDNQMSEIQQKPKISVVLAAWKGEQYIVEQLDSIAAQTVKPDEILIRDDRSPDQTVKVVKDWIEKHPKLDVQLIEGDQNVGYIENFRLLLEQAKGDWIFLSDQDDRWHVDKIEKMMEQAGRYPDLCLIASSFSFMDPESNVYELPVREGWSNNNLIPWQIEHPGGMNRISEEQMLLHNYFQGCAMMVRKDLVDRYLKSGQKRLAHDWMLALMASVEDGLGYYDQKLFDYRIHQSNTTGLPQAKKRSKILTLKTWFNRYYRRVVIADMENVLLAYQEAMPERWDKTKEQRLDFCSQYLQAIDTRDFSGFLKLKNHPARTLCMTGKEYLVGAVYVFLSQWIDFPDRKI